MEELIKEQWKAALAKESDAVLLDVRTPEEWAEGIQEGAQLLNILDAPSFMKGAEKLDASKPHYIYCRSGARSAQACQFLSQKGFTTYNLIGGMLEWDGPITTPEL